MTAGRYKILEKYNFQVPRYTSFPPATQFREIEDQTPYLEWLSGAGKDISLYIHVPFCARLCHYCGCHMRVVNNYQPVQDYLEVLKTEIDLIKEKLPRNAVVSHLHFGGGSPTIIRPGDFSRLVGTIGEAIPFRENMEFSVEADPRHLSEAKIASYARSGVNRISFGVQDFNEEVLDLINRPQPFHVTYRALQTCRSYGLDNINFDLMYGLPGQTKDSILKTIELAISLRPSRIAYFGYAHVPWMKRHMNLMPQDRMPTPRDRFFLQEAGSALLEVSGYTPVGIDHFCLSDDSMTVALRERKLHRNFQGYTTDAASSLIGLGASSIGSYAKGYLQNRVDIRSYMDDIRHGRLPLCKALAFQKSDLPVKKIIEEIMCYLRVDLKEICKEFSLPQNAFQEEKKKLLELEKDGIVRVKDGVVEVTSEFRVLARVVCEVFDPYTIKESPFQRHAQAV